MHKLTFNKYQPSLPAVRVGWGVRLGREMRLRSCTAGLECACCSVTSFKASPTDYYYCSCTLLYYLLPQYGQYGREVTAGCCIPHLREAHVFSDTPPSYHATKYNTAHHRPARINSNTPAHTFSRSLTLWAHQQASCTEKATLWIQADPW